MRTDCAVRWRNPRSYFQHLGQLLTLATEQCQNSPKLLNISGIHFTTVEGFFFFIFASSSLKSNACRLEAKNYTGLGILRKVLQKVDRSKASGRHQASCHLFYCFSVSPRVKGRGAKCAWERLSLTRCMCLYQSVTHTVRL